MKKYDVESCPLGGEEFQNLVGDYVEAKDEIEALSFYVDCLLDESYGGQLFFDCQRFNRFKLSG